MSKEEQKWLFVVNPKAGKKRGFDVRLIIDAQMTDTAHDVMDWVSAEDFSSIGAAIKSGLYTHVVAVGGDGTVNRVGRELLGMTAVLGILPLGSGNGLARSLGLSMEPAAALKQLLLMNTTNIDAGSINGRPFFCTAGMGFDAHIGGLFAASERRGLRSYVQIVLKELLRYRAKNYTISVDGRTSSRPAFLITVANAGQYGNDFYIAPLANLQDGILQVVILSPFNVIRAPGIFRRILSRQAHLSQSIITLEGKRILIERESEGLIHFDGEPLHEKKTLNFETHPRALRVLTGPGFSVFRENAGNAQGR